MTRNKVEPARGVDKMNTMPGSRWSEVANGNMPPNTVGEYRG
jgi:hypothetical protein